MLSEEYIKKYGKRTILRTSSQIQQPFEKPKKHRVPVDLIISQTEASPLYILDRAMLDDRSKLVWKFIRNER